MQGSCWGGGFSTAVVEHNSSGGAHVIQSRPRQLIELSSERMDHSLDLWGHFLCAVGLAETAHQHAGRQVVQQQSQPLAVADGQQKTILPAAHHCSLAGQVDALLLWQRRAPCYTGSGPSVEHCPAVAPARRQVAVLIAELCQRAIRYDLLFLSDKGVPSEDASRKEDLKLIVPHLVM